MVVFLPEGTEWLDFMTPMLADSPVGKGDVVRILQYGVREGREVRRAVHTIETILAECENPCILEV